jgi:hypothetical protein
MVLEDSLRYRLTIKELNHMDNRSKERNKKKELDKNAKWITVVLSLLPPLFILGLFGWSARYQAFGISLIVAHLALYWFRRDKSHVLVAFAMALITIWLYIES